MVEIIRLRGVGSFKVVDCTDIIEALTKNLRNWKRVKHHYTLHKAFETIAFSTFQAQKTWKFRIYHWDMFLVIILSKNAHIWKCLSEQKVTWYGFMNFHEVWVKNDGTTLFQNPVRFFA